MDAYYIISFKVNILGEKHVFLLSLNMYAFAWFYYKSLKSEDSNLYHHDDLDICNSDKLINQHNETISITIYCAVLIL